MAIIKEESKTFPLWFQDETVNANYRDEYLRCLNNIKEALPTSTFSQISAGGLSTYWGSVLAPNGTDIYFVPKTPTAVGKIDTLTDTVSTFGTTPGGNAFYGGVLADNGFIYLIPNNSTAVYKINTVDDSITNFGSLVGSNKWFGGVITQDGIIYGVPASSSQILKIDTSTDTVSLIGSGLNGYNSACIGGNGKIYFVPTNNNNGVLKINTNNDTVSLIAGIGGVGKEYVSSHIGADGFIYCIPYYQLSGGTDLIAIDPDTDTDTIVASSSNFVGKEYMGSSLAKNGIIYCTPRQGNTILKIGAEQQISKQLGISNFNNKT